MSSRAPAAEGGPAAARAGRAPASGSTSSSASPFPPRAHSPALIPRPVPASPRADHIHPFFQKLFETGVDEMSWDDMVSARERSEWA